MTEKTNVKVEMVELTNGQLRILGLPEVQSIILKLNLSVPQKMFIYKAVKGTESLALTAAMQQVVEDEGIDSPQGKTIGFDNIKVQEILSEPSGLSLEKMTFVVPKDVSITEMFLIDFMVNWKD